MDAGERVQGLGMTGSFKYQVSSENAEIKGKRSQPSLRFGADRELVFIIRGVGLWNAAIIHDCQIR